MSNLSYYLGARCTSASLFLSSILAYSFVMQFKRYRRFSNIKRIGSQRTRDFWESKNGEHSFLEEVEGDKALDWVRSQNAISLSKLGNPETNPAYKTVLEILNSKEKIPYVSKIGDLYYNFWQDAQNIRGLLRRTTLDSYQTANPHWETVLDLDKLGMDEGESWVYKGSHTFYPFDGSAPTRSLIMLSPGGSDACVYREFDLVTCKFIPEADNGFVLPVAKSSISWLSQDALLLGTDFAKNKSSLTDSGYPMDVRLWKRGTDYMSANKLFEGAKSDVSVSGYVSRHRNVYYEWRRRALDFYTSKKYLRRIYPDMMINPSIVLDNYDSLGCWHELDVPTDASVSTFGEYLLISLKTSWKLLDISYPAGSLLTAPIEEFINKGKEGVVISALFTPNEKERISLESYSITLNFLVLEILENVKSRLSILKFSDGAWSSVGGEDCARIRGISISAVDSMTSDECWVTRSSFTNPSTLALVDLHTFIKRGDIDEMSVKKMKTLPSYFNSQGLVEIQREAVSKDGTKIPYFLVMRNDIAFDGTNPTLLYGYGGFLISLLPSYAAVTGACWLQNGGVYVSANIRGGAEMGPDWHKAALREKRHKAYEDFIAVAEDLIKLGVTSVGRLAIRGGSNGGLLVGNMMTMRPDLFGAIVCAVPLLDMKRYNHLLAGASWMAEYGDPDKDDDWDFLQQFSPYHNIEPTSVKYPPLLVTTSTKDDRVHPYHARAFVKRLHDIGAEETTFYYENIEGGHGGAADNKQQAFMTVLYFEFLNKVIGKSK